MSHSTLFKALSFAKLGDIFKDKKHIFEEPTVEPQTLRNSKSTPNLKREEPRSIKRSTSRFVKNGAHLPGSNKIWTFIICSLLFRGRVNHTIRQRSHSGSSSLSSRDPSLPIKSLPGPPVPPRAYSHLHLNMTSNQGQEGLKMRRSISESKVDKNAKNEERAQKARSVHFDGKEELRPVSIIGSNGVNGTSNGTKPLETNMDDLPPPPPQGKRKVIVAQRPHSLLWNLKVRRLLLLFLYAFTLALDTQLHTCCAVCFMSRACLSTGYFIT